MTSTGTCLGGDGMVMGGEVGEPMKTVSEKVGGAGSLSSL